MSSITSVGTYLPPWGSERARVPGLDEDALTMAVEAGLAACSASEAAISRVVFVSRDLPLLTGGNSAALLAGLGLPRELEVIEQLGGAPSVLDAVAVATPGTLVVTAELEPSAAAAAALIGEGDGIELKGRVHRSLPIIVEGRDGRVYEDDDPRLVRERGSRASIEALGLEAKPYVVAGLAARESASFSAPGAPALPVGGAPSALFALATALESGAAQTVVAVEQATATALCVSGSSPVVRIEPAAQETERRSATPGEIKVALTAYDRAFDSKLRWQAGRCPACGTLALPPRHRCFECGEEGSSVLVPLPRMATVYTQTTVRVPVPGLSTPYTLAVVELDGVGVRSLVTVTDSPSNSSPIGSSGTMVFRRVATRTGVPDYGYAFSPEGFVSRPRPSTGGVR
jgi:uncharacterized OB-fold protein